MGFIESQQRDYDFLMFEYLFWQQLEEGLSRW